MSNGSDVTGALGWGLRMYAWLVVLFVIALGLVVPAALERTPEQFQASASVGPIRVLRLANFDVLPRMATDVFRSVPDAPDVKAAAGVPASDDLSANQLEVVAAQDNIIFTVIARSSSPKAARDLANVAAARFVAELNIYSQAVGSFAVSRLATTPTEPEPRLTGLTAKGIGAVSGLLAGLGIVALLLLLRRPVIDVAAARDLAGAPVLGRITLGRRGTSAAGMNQVCHRILSQPTGMVLMVGAADTRRQRHELTDELASWLSRVRRVIPLGSREPVDAYGSASLALPGYPDVLFILDDASPVEVATRPGRSLALLVIREGISRAALQEQAQQYLDGESGAVVLVRRASRLSRLRHGRGSAAPRSLQARHAPVTNEDDASWPLVEDRDDHPIQSSIPPQPD